MKKLMLVALCAGLSGCIGTKVTGRDVDTSAPHPSLHTVPNRPAPKDFKKIDAERVDFDKDHESKLVQNTNLRKKLHAPDKKPAVEPAKN